MTADEVIAQIEQSQYLHIGVLYDYDIYTLSVYLRHGITSVGRFETFWDAVNVADEVDYRIKALRRLKGLS